MKHKAILISHDDLVSRLFRDSDNFELGDAVEEVPTATTDWFIVQWPQHVISPRFNSDATYFQFNQKSEAEEWLQTAPKMDYREYYS